MQIFFFCISALSLNFIRFYQYSYSSAFFVLAIVFLQSITPLYLACIVAYLHMFISQLHFFSASLPDDVVTMMTKRSSSVFIVGFCIELFSRLANIFSRFQKFLPNLPIFSKFSCFFFFISPSKLVCDALINIFSEYDMVLTT